MSYQACWFLKIFFQYTQKIYTASIVFQNSTDLHEYSLVQTSLNIIHQYIFIDNKNPGGRESTLFC